MAKSTQSNKHVFMNGLKELYKEQWQANILLKGGDSAKDAAIPAHKLVLAGRSKVFKKLLESDGLKASSELETVTLFEMKHEEVKALVDFIYNFDGFISYETLNKHVRSLYIAADKYDIPHLRDVCRDHLIASLCASNALNILVLAQIPLDKTLDEWAFSTIIANLPAIVNYAEFKLFVVQHPQLTVDIIKASINNCRCGCGRYRY